MYDQWKSDFQISSNGSHVGQDIDIKSDTALFNISMPHGLVDRDTNNDKTQVQEESDNIDSQLMTTIQEEESNQADPPSLFAPAPGFKDSNKAILSLLQGGIGSGTSVISTTGGGSDMTQSGAKGISQGSGGRDIASTDIAPRGIVEGLETGAAAVTGAGGGILPSGDGGAVFFFQSSAPSPAL